MSLNNHNKSLLIKQPQQIPSDNQFYMNIYVFVYASYIGYLHACYMSQNLTN